MAEGGGKPRCGVVILWSVGVVEALTRSELTGESTRGWGENRDLASAIRGEKSWVVLIPPNSVLHGWEMVSNMDIGGEKRRWQQKALEEGPFVVGLGVKRGRVLAGREDAGETQSRYNGFEASERIGSKRDQKEGDNCK